MRCNGSQDVVQRTDTQSAVRGNRHAVMGGIFGVKDDVAARHASASDDNTRHLPSAELPHEHLQALDQDRTSVQSLEPLAIGHLPYLLCQRVRQRPEADLQDGKYVRA